MVLIVPRPDVPALPLNEAARCSFAIESDYMYLALIASAVTCDLSRWGSPQPANWYIHVVAVFIVNWRFALLYCSDHKFGQA
jgi:hypothetical protein